MKVQSFNPAPNRRCRSPGAAPVGEREASLTAGAQLRAWAQPRVWLAGVGLCLVSFVAAPGALNAQSAGSGAGASGQAEKPDNRSFFDRLFGRKAEPEQPQIPVPDAVPYEVTIDVGGDDDTLEQRIRDASNLEELKKSPPSGAEGLVQRASADLPRLFSTMAALGYYEAKITVTVAGVDVDSTTAAARVNSARRAGPVPVVINVNPGRLFTFGSLKGVNAATGAAVDPPEAWAKLNFARGEPAESSVVLSAEAALVARFRDIGHAFAKAVKRDAIVDYATGQMDVTLRVEPGPLVRFGDVKISGTERLNPGFIRRRVTFRPGDVFSTAALDDFRRELNSYDVFDSVRIREGSALNDAGELPIDVEVKERLPRFVGFSAKYSNTDGPSVNAYWGHRNLFGNAERLRLDATVAGASGKILGADGKEVPWRERLGFNFGGTFEVPGIFTVQDDLIVKANYLRNVTENYTQQGFLGSVGVKREFSKEFTAQVGLSFERAKFTRAYSDVGGGGSYYTLVGIPVEATYDTTDSKLDPTRGFRVTGTVTPYPSFLGSTIGMTSMTGTASAYLSLDTDSRYILAGRVRMGSIVGAGLYDIPPPHRFFAGGGGSVRGYDYQSIGPKDAFGRVIGGRSLLEGSVEMRVKVTDTIGVVPFVDAGGAFRDSVPSFDDDIKYSAGIGLRYYTSLGPLRLDVARGLNRDKGDPPYGIYMSLGQSF
ncbi:Autotransporter secretion outer membrane protein TamA [Hyphomicrobiales bacterium]|nr:Autotransporter secretion outer membrane protein TamA [Hyphomicrobiales bacterium]CAH1685668.1 Autotransporter secretion outer membrane protein TamA [Hyphomicrobiales bacterium]